MGNRGGVLHNERREIVRPYATRRWITCLLEFRGRRRTVMSPNRYTELFFLDEAVALAAGHRPCAECRRERFVAFRNAWMQAAGWKDARPVYADEMDLELQQARIDRRKNKVVFAAPLRSLPNGCFIRMSGAAWLVRDDVLLRWSPEGYVENRRVAGAGDIEVLTPKPIVECLRQGYRPEFHSSATDCA